MRRLALFAFITVAFCPPIGMLLMLAYAALTGGLGQLSLGLSGVCSASGAPACCSRRLRRWPLSAAPNAGTGPARDGCCFALARRAGGSAMPVRVL